MLHVCLVTDFIASCSAFHVPLLYSKLIGACKTGQSIVWLLTTTNTIITTTTTRSLDRRCFDLYIGPALCTHVAAVSVNGNSAELLFALYTDIELFHRLHYRTIDTSVSMATVRLSLLCICIVYFWAELHTLSIQVTITAITPSDSIFDSDCICTFWVILIGLSLG